MREKFKKLEESSYQYNCLNCKTKYCLHEIKEACPFCQSKAIIITKPEAD